MKLTMQSKQRSERGEQASGPVGQYLHPYSPVLFETSVECPWKTAPVDMKYHGEISLQLRAPLRSFARSLAHGKAVIVHKMNTSIAYNSIPPCTAALWIETV